MEQGHIFLSYRSLEADFALKVAGDLKKAGLRVWMDRLDGDVGIHVGMDWRDTLEHALNECVGLVAILSPGYVESEYCRKELARVNTLGRPIYPVLLEKVEARKIPLAIEGIQWVDFTKALDDEDSYRVGIGKLLERLRTSASGVFGSAADEEKRYLIDLIVDLESRRGVQEYVELRGSTAEVRPRPPSPLDEWGYTRLVPANRDTDVPEAREIELSNIHEALDTHRRFVLVGEPGAGKTTTIRRLARLVAQDRMENPRTAALPFFVYLSQWQAEDPFEQFLMQQWPFDTDPFPLLGLGDIWLYLDGLNEMGAGDAERIRELRAWLHGEFKPRQVIVTSRKNDYDDQLDLPVVAIKPLAPVQIQQFARNYLEERADDFIERVLPDEETRTESKHLTALARNPYLLGALIYLYQESAARDLPQNNGDLSQRLAQALWEREKKRRTPGWMPFDTMAAALSRLAFDMIDEDRGTEVPIAYAVNKLRNRGWLRWKWRAQVDGLLHAAQRANLLEQRGHYVRFYHQLLQEYFAALHLLDVGIVGRVKPLLATGVSGFRPADKWDQVVIAACGIGDGQCDGLMTEIAALDPCLAVDCLTSGVHVSESTAQAVHQEVARCINDRTNWRTRRVAVEAAAKLRALDLLHMAARDFDAQVRQEALEHLHGLADPASIPVLVENLGFRDPGIQARARAVLMAQGEPAIDALYDLLPNATGDIRRAIIESLAATEGGLQRLWRDYKLTDEEKLQALRFSSSVADITFQLERLCEILPGASASLRPRLMNLLKEMPAIDLSQLLESQILTLAETRDIMNSNSRPGVGLRPDGLPDIEWCEIPAGPFLYGEGKDEIDIPYTFSIAKYPITYRQFQVFIDDPEGWRNPRWWDGLAEANGYKQEPPTQIFAGYNQPRGNLNWYDVTAYCRWLSWRLGGGYDLSRIVDWSVRLPTGFEWEKAARGTDGRIYPYGDTFDANKGNTQETGLFGTSPVGMFPAGASLYGVMDMSGNVWEWCLTDIDQLQMQAVDENILVHPWGVLRGGSYLSHSDEGRATAWMHESWLRSNSYGFRVVRPPY